MDPATASAYAQLSSLGVLYVALHCSGMCGPLVVGLGVGDRARGAAAMGRVLTYQLGKATIYAPLGALAGLLGRGVVHGLARHGTWLTALLGVALIAASLRARFSRSNAAPMALLAPLVHRADRLRERPWLRAFALGLVMAALPCMLVLWALALAATTHHPLHGALLMLLLLAMSSVPLLAAVRLSALVRTRAPRLARLQPWLPTVSGVWLLLVALAGAGWLPHASLPLSLGGRGYVVMFW